MVRLIKVERGASAQTQQLEELIASSRSVLCDDRLTVPPWYSLAAVPVREGERYSARYLLESVDTIDLHLHGQLCAEGDSVVLAKLYNFLDVPSPEEVVISSHQIVHLYEHLLLHPLSRRRTIKNRSLQARSFGHAIFFDNTFEEGTEAVCNVVWEALLATFRGCPYPTPTELKASFGAQDLWREITLKPTAS